MFRTMNSDLSPWRFLDDWIRESWGDPRPVDFGGRASLIRYPRVNVWEGDDALVVDAELPGIDPKNVDITVDNAELAISGALPGRKDDENARRFERRFELPFAVNPENVEAVYRAGLLRITLPKAEEAKRRRITVHS